MVVDVFDVKPAVFTEVRSIQTSCGRGMDHSIHIFL
jgi:hypothetical protein